MLATSRALAPAEAVDLAGLSRTFGEAQKFATHRVTEYHEWQRWVAGATTRRFAYSGVSGEVHFDEGSRGEAEEGLLSQASIEADHWDAVEYPDEEVVMTIARAWSVDPTALDRRTDLLAEGLLASMPH